MSSKKKISKEEYNEVIYDFFITRKQLEKINKWLKKHLKKCKFLKENKKAFLTYCFQPNGIGESVVVKCDCGEELDLTDVSEW